MTEIDLESRTRVWSPLSKLEQISVSSKLSMEEQNMALVEEQLKEYRGKIENLQKQNAASEERRIPLLSLCAPIRRIPRELLCEIFTWSNLTSILEYKYGYRKNDSSSAYTSWSTVTVPCLTLSRVCLAWHNIVKDAAFLWTSISVKIQQPRYEEDEESFPQHVQRLSNAIQSILTRTRNCSLDVTINYMQDWVGEENAGIRLHRDTLLKLLLEQCPRWKHAEFDIPRLGVLYDGEVYRRVSNQLPLLETLSITAHNSRRAANAQVDSDDSDQEYFVCDLFSSAPKLHKVRMKFRDSFWGTIRMDLPWKQLHELELEYSFFNETHFREVISEASSLRSLDISGTFLDTVEGHPSPPLHLDTITTIRVKNSVECCFSSFALFSRLTNLTVTIVQDSKDLWIALKCVFLETFATLIAFTFDSAVAIYLEDALDAVSRLQNLASLTIKANIIEMSAFNFPYDSLRRQLKKLRSASLVTTHAPRQGLERIVDSSLDFFTAFCQRPDLAFPLEPSSYTDTFTRLQKARLKLLRIGPFPENGKPRLKQLLDDGLDIIVRDVKGLVNPELQPEPSSTS